MEDAFAGLHIGGTDIEDHRILFKGIRIERIEFVGKLTVTEIRIVEITRLY